MQVLSLMGDPPLDLPHLDPCPHSPGGLDNQWKERRDTVSCPYLPVLTNIACAGQLNPQTTEILSPVNTLFLLIIFLPALSFLGEGGAALSVSH